MLGVIDLARYLLVCLLFVGAGTGLVRLLRVRVAPALAVLLAPVLAQALLCCIWALTVVAGMPLKYVALPIAVIVIGLAALGVRSLLAAGARSFLLLGVSAMVSALVMLPFFLHGLADYPGSGALDGWGYAIFGQYLWEHARTVEGGLTPVFQFASKMSMRRYSASAELGLFSLLYAPGDLAAANGLLRALALFTFTAGCAAFIEIRGGIRLALVLLYVALCGMSGWMLDAVWANNYDNTLALAFYPAAIALILLPATLTSISGAALLGLVTAGAVYAYPELVPMTLGGVTLVVAETVWRRRPDRWPLYLTAALAVFLLLLLPSRSDLYWFFEQQVVTGLGIARNGPAPPPGTGMFFGLLDRQTLASGLWGMGGERGRFPGSVVLLVTSAWLFVLIGIGLWRLLRGREIALAATLLTHAAGAAWLLGYTHYDYGAYKMLLLGWWLAAFALVVAVSWLIDRVPVRSLVWSKGRWLAWGVATASLLIVPITTAVRIAKPPGEYVPRPVHDYHVIDRVVPLIGGTPLVLLTEDEQATHWGAYYLRSGQLLLGTRNGYVAMPQVQERLSRAQPVSPRDVRLVVTDADASVRAIDTSGWSLAWSAGAFALWDTGGRGWGAITSIRDPQIFRASTRPIFYIHRDITTLDVLASDPGELTFSGTIEGSANVSHPPCWRLQVHGGDGQAWDVNTLTGPVSFTVRVPAGASEITMHGTDAGAPATHPDVLIGRMTSRFRRADTGSDGAGHVTPPAQYQLCIPTPTVAPASPPG
jgi:hypothetical protein